MGLVLESQYHSDVPPSTLIWWSRAVLHKVILTLGYTQAQHTPQAAWMQMHFPLTGNITFFNIQHFLSSPLSQIRQTPQTNTASQLHHATDTNNLCSPL